MRQQDIKQQSIYHIEHRTKKLKYVEKQDINKLEFLIVSIKL